MVATVVTPLSARARQRFGPCFFRCRLAGTGAPPAIQHPSKESPAKHDGEQAGRGRGRRPDLTGQPFAAHWLTRAFAIQAAARVMALHGRGKIVAVGTDAGRVATVGESFIGGATAGMMQMCRVLARELGRDGIRVNAVAMSYIWDAEPRWGPGSPALEGGHGKGMIENLRKRMLFPVHCQDIANAAAFFAGPESDAITGQTLSVNGGLSTPG